MRILLVHNKYQQRGGEDTVFEAESCLLRDAGVEVHEYVTDNDSISGVWEKLRAARNAVFSPSQFRHISHLISSIKPDVIHVHNFFPIISPAVFLAAKQCGVPVVLTLHNYRLFCANGLLTRDDNPCTDCLGKLPWRAIRHRCYRGSMLGSATVSTMISYHSAVGTWNNSVDRFIALTEFAADLFVKAGLPIEKIRIKGNSTQRFPEPIKPAIAREGYVFVGRLSREKGIACLIEAWENCELPLTVIGSGPLEGEVGALAKRNPHVSYIGAQAKGIVLSQVARAKALIVPSTWFENYPMTVVEALCCGTPVIASDLGALPHILGHQDKQMLFRPNDSAALMEATRFVERLDPGYLDIMIEAAARKFEFELSPDVAVRNLLAIYDELRLTH